MSSTPREPSGGPVKTTRRPARPRISKSRGPKFGGPRSRKNGSKGWRMTAHDEEGKPAVVAVSRSLSHRNTKLLTTVDASGHVPSSRETYNAA